MAPGGIRSQMSGIRGQERNQESEVRSQRSGKESGVRSQESAVRNQGLGFWEPDLPPDSCLLTPHSYNIRSSDDALCHKGEFGANPQTNHGFSGKQAGAARAGPFRAGP